MEYTWKVDGEPGTDVVGDVPVLISSFPSAGLATTVAGHYIIRALQLPRVGRFDSPDSAPIAVVQDGEVNPTIRVYGRKGFALILSEFPPTAGQANAAARAILTAARARKARLVVCLEGVVPHPDDEADGDAAAPESAARVVEQVWGAYSHRDAAVVKLFEAARVKPLEDGVIGGVSGALLVQALGGPVPVAVLLVSANAAEGLPDHRAGAALIETLDRVLPELKIDTGPLRAQAEAIEKALRSAMKRRSEMPAPPEGEAPSESGMYR
ncbi:MAG TPA: PAC2 family protein [Thermoplasmata archaeon]|nr:PAC2 family protein [Thermoplasmata archaeon]